MSRLNEPSSHSQDGSGTYIYVRNDATRRQTPWPARHDGVVRNNGVRFSAPAASVPASIYPCDAGHGSQPGHIRGGQEVRQGCRSQYPVGILQVSYAIIVCFKFCSQQLPKSLFRLLRPWLRCRPPRPGLHRLSGGL